MAMFGRKTILWTSSSLGLLLGLGHLYYFLTGDFRPGNVLMHAPYPLEVPAPCAEDRQHIQQILDQEFDFLGHGHQTFVFASRDQRYVLKLFKSDYLQYSWAIHVLPPIPPFKHLFLHRGAKKESRLRKVLHGYTVAYAYDRDNSGLLCFSPNQKGKMMGQSTIRLNTLGRGWLLNVNSVVFAIQKKAVTTCRELTQQLAAGNVDKAKQRLKQLFSLYLSEFQRGIIDRDENLLDNTGFVDDRAIRFDVGKISLDAGIVNEAAQRALLKKIVSKRLKPWIRSRFPRYFSDLSLEMDQLLAALGEG
ncbi:MAG: hypothetical protein WB791_10780 [Waddliaceae bacterium]